MLGDLECPRPRLMRRRPSVGSGGGGGGGVAVEAVEAGYCGVSCRARPTCGSVLPMKLATSATKLRRLRCAGHPTSHSI